MVAVAGGLTPTQPPFANRVDRRTWFGCQLLAAAESAQLSRSFRTIGGNYALVKTGLQHRLAPGQPTNHLGAHQRDETRAQRARLSARCTFHDERATLGMIACNDRDVANAAGRGIVGIARNSAYTGHRSARDG